MKCANHPGREAVADCAECGKHMCADCAISLGARSWCKECLEALVEQAGGRHGRWRRRWHRYGRKLVAALLSLIPGAGHMYLGLIGKGFALMGLLIASIFLIVLYSDVTGMYWITAFLVPTLGVLFLCYAVFDSMEIADAIKSGKDPGAVRDPTMNAVWERVFMNRRTGGWVLLISGAVGVLSLFSDVLQQLMKTYLSLDFRITALVVPVVLLVIGATLLRKGKTR